MVYWITTKMNNNIRMHFEHSQSDPTELPTLQEVYTFLKTRFQATQAMPNRGNDGQRCQKDTSVKNHIATSSTKNCNDEKNHHVGCFYPLVRRFLGRFSLRVYIFK